MNTLIEQAVPTTSVGDFNLGFNRPQMTDMFFQDVAPGIMNYDSENSMENTNFTYSSLGFKQDFKRQTPQDNEGGPNYLNDDNVKWGKQKLEQSIIQDKDDPIMCDFVLDEGLLCDPITVYTEDGYIIDMFRVTAPGLPYNAKPVFIQHGLMSDSSTWVVHKQDSLAILLANKGYDVFVGNNRGNYYGRKHKTLDPDKNSMEFFDYSFYEIGMYDLTAQLNQVHKIKQTKLSYIGHSQGTTSMFAQLADNGYMLKERIDMFIALAPIVHMEHIKSEQIKLASRTWEAIYYFLEFGLHLYEFNDSQSHKQKVFCDKYTAICGAFLDAFYGNSDYHDEESAKKYNQQQVTSVSTKQLIHFAQLISKAEFIQFDYLFPNSNYGHYSEPNPPMIELKNIPEGIPIALLVGKQDDLADKTDVDRLKDELEGHMLGRVVMHKEYDDFDHNCFAICKDMTWTQDVLELLKKYGEAPKIDEQAKRD